MRLLILLVLSLFSFPSMAEEGIFQVPLPPHEGALGTTPDETLGTVSFKPPLGWGVADPKVLPKNVHLMVVGKGLHEYPPSINLATDHHVGSLKDYLKIVKKINDDDDSEWKDLGPIETLSGEGNLSEVISRTQWGEVKMMHTILKKGDTVFILTASALKEEFSKFYREFFEAMKSLKVSTSDAKKGQGTTGTKDLKQ